MATTCACLPHAPLYNTCDCYGLSQANDDLNKGDVATWEAAVEDGLCPGVPAPVLRAIWRRQNNGRSDQGASASAEQQPADMRRSPGHATQSTVSAGSATSAAAAPPSRAGVKRARPSEPGSTAAAFVTQDLDTPSMNTSGSSGQTAGAGGAGAKAAGACSPIRPPSSASATTLTPDAHLTMSSELAPTQDSATQAASAATAAGAPVQEFSLPLAQQAPGSGATLNEQQRLSSSGSGIASSALSPMVGSGRRQRATGEAGLAAPEQQFQLPRSRTIGSRQAVTSAGQPGGLQRAQSLKLPTRAAPPANGNLSLRRSSTVPTPASKPRPAATRPDAPTSAQSARTGSLSAGLKSSLDTIAVGLRFDQLSSTQGSGSIRLAQLAPTQVTHTSSSTPPSSNVATSATAPDTSQSQQHGDHEDSPDSMCMLDLGLGVQLEQWSPAPPAPNTSASPGSAAQAGSQSPLRAADQHAASQLASQSTVDSDADTQATADTDRNPVAPALISQSFAPALGAGGVDGTSSLEPSVSPQSSLAASQPLPASQPESNNQPQSISRDWIPTIRPVVILTSSEEGDARSDASDSEASAEAEASNGDSSNGSSASEGQPKYRPPKPGSPGVVHGTATPSRAAAHNSAPSQSSPELLTTPTRRQVCSARRRSAPVSRVSPAPGQEAIAGAEQPPASKPGKLASANDEPAASRQPSSSGHTSASTLRARIYRLASCRRVPVAVVIRELRENGGNMRALEDAAGMR